jgi:Carbonic anhydrase
VPRWRGHHLAERADGPAVAGRLPDQAAKLAVEPGPIMRAAAGEPARSSSTRAWGDLFVVRTAGHVMGPEVLGSIEYGVGVLGCPLVVVLGHDACGAVAAARAAVQDGTPAEGYVRDVIERVTSPALRS